MGALPPEVFLRKYMGRLGLWCVQVAIRCAPNQAQSHLDVALRLASVRPKNGGFLRVFPSLPIAQLLKMGLKTLHVVCSRRDGPGGGSGGSILILPLQTWRRLRGKPGGNGRGQPLWQRSRGLCHPRDWRRIASPLCASIYGWLGCETDFLAKDMATAEPSVTPVSHPLACHPLQPSATRQAMPAKA